MKDLGRLTESPWPDATQRAILEMAVVFARHLRYDHEMSRRKLALTLGVREKWVRDVVEGGEFL